MARATALGDRFARNDAPEPAEGAFYFDASRRRGDVRGDRDVSSTALRTAGFDLEADRLRSVSLGTPESTRAWEDYARWAFAGHAEVHTNAPGKLRFLQYVTNPTRAWWAAREAQGALSL